MKNIGFGVKASESFESQLYCCKIGKKHLNSLSFDVFVSEIGIITKPAYFLMVTSVPCDSTLDRIIKGPFVVIIICRSSVKRTGRRGGPPAWLGFQEHPWRSPHLQHTRGCGQFLRYRHLPHSSTFTQPELQLAWLSLLDFHVLSP